MRYRFLGVLLPLALGTGCKKSVPPPAVTLEVLEKTQLAASTLKAGQIEFHVAFEESKEGRQKANFQGKDYFLDPEAAFSSEDLVGLELEKIRVGKPSSPPQISYQLRFRLNSLGTKMLAEVAQKSRSSLALLNQGQVTWIAPLPVPASPGEFLFPSIPVEAQARELYRSLVPAH